MVNSNVIWQIRCHVIAIRQSSAQLSIINNCNRSNPSEAKIDRTLIEIESYLFHPTLEEGHMIPERNA